MVAPPRDPPLPDDDVQLTLAERAEIDGMYLRLASGTLYDVLGVAPDGERRAIRDAYFALSQRFHPDAFYGRRLGPWGARIEQIFREVTRAYDTLSSRPRRADYDAARLGPAAARPLAPSMPAPAPPSAAPALQPDPALAPRLEPRARATTPDAAARAASLPAPPDSLPPAAATRDSAASSSFDPVAARRAAREVFARKMARPPAANTAAAQALAPRVSPLESLEATKAQRVAAERSDVLARVARLRLEADAALAVGNLVSAANALTVARALAPDDRDLAHRADDAARRLAESMRDQYIEQARACERAGKWEDAAVLWQKAWLGKQTDMAALLSAARALLRTGRELPKAAELARRAVQIAPRSIDAHTTLAQVFLAAGMRASAQSAAEAAQRLDPTSPLVKDLIKQLRG